MAGLFDRTMTIIKAKWNKLLNRAENPQETLDYSYGSSSSSCRTSSVAWPMSSPPKRLELQAGKLETSVPKLESQARDALAHGREVSRMALERKTAAQAQLQDLDRQVSELESQQGKLRANERSRRRSRASCRGGRQAQYSAAEASVRIGGRRPGSATRWPTLERRSSARVRRPRRCRPARARWTS